ncbi:hypothetical protein TrVE_jg13962 [Triparma verrucosa]|uniref:Amidohydrolase-related domain-containing protein n=1 Tax=Triparma verrucosa TaxID=1606542 RepID=A0A9W7FN24_9STRA|nr:hypothetical protein TrVE_jg13962 [Triparma verrucosa]
MIVLASSRCVLPASYLSESDPARPSLGESSDDGLCITQAYIVVDPQISGKIVAVLVNTGLEEVQEKYANVEIRDYGDDVIMPGIVDAQSCFTEPGLSLPSRGNKTFGHVKGEENSSGDSDGGLATSQDRDKCWEGFCNGTRAAAAGGITCVADFPCHGHKVTVHNVSAFHSKIALAKSQILVDMAFYALATPPNIFSTESATSLVGMLKAGAIGVVAYLTTQSMGVPGLSGHDWNMLMYKLDKEVRKDSEEVSYEAKQVPVMLSAVLMSADRHKIVDPLYMAENPYTSIVEGFTEATPLGLDFTFGDKTNGSSSENSPVKPELADIIQKNKEEGQRRMASISNLEQQRARDREKGEMPPRQLSPVNNPTEPKLSQVRDSLVTTPVSGNRKIKDSPATTPDQKSRSLFDSGSPDAPHLRSTRSNEGSATDLGELMSFAMDDEPEQNAVPVYMLAAPRQLRRSGNTNFSESADLASAAKDSLKEMQSEFDFVNPTKSQYPLSHKDHNPIVTQVASYRTSGPSLSQRQMSLESNESSGPRSSGPLVYGRLSPQRLSPPDTLPGSTNHSPQYNVDAESQKEGGKKEWAEVDINEINWGKDPADPPRISAALEIPLKTTESEESERNDFESFDFTPDYDITFDEIERAKSPARGLSSSVKATLLSVERKSYKYKRPTSTSSVASSSDGTDSPRMNASPARLRRSKSGNVSSSNDSASPSRSRVGWAESSSYSVEENDRFWKKNQKEMSKSGVWGFNDLVKRRESSDSSEGESRATGSSSSKFQSSSAITPPTPMFYSKDGKDDSSAFSGLGSQLSSSLPNPSKLNENKKGKEITDKGKKKKFKFRPPPIKPFKESDTLTMVAMRREYLLFLHDFPSTMEEFGISSVFTYKYLASAAEKKNRKIGRGGGGSDVEGTLAKRKQSEGTPKDVKTLNIHVINVSSQNGCIRISQAKAVEDKRARLRAKKEGATRQLVCEGESDDELELYSENEKSHAKWPEFAEVTSSTSIYYLTHDSGMIEAGDTLFKVFPPIRRREHRLALWENINNGALDFITSGHMPTDIDLKFLRDGDFYRAFTGMISIELMLPAFFTESEVQARENRDIRFVASEGRAEGETMKTTDSTIVNMVKFMCQKPAKFLGLDKVKGSLEVGMDADIVVWSPESTFTVNSEGHTLQSKQIRSVWDGAKLKGVVKRTFVRGKCVFERSEGGDARFPTSEQPTGMIIKGNL